jgi:hypothetical protein
LADEKDFHFIDSEELRGLNFEKWNFSWLSLLKLHNRIVRFEFP